MSDYTLLGIDYGAQKIGLALGRGQVAAPYTIIENSEIGLAALAEIITSERVERIVVGLPMSFSKKTTDATHAVRAFITQLHTITNVPIETADETLTSKQAQQMGAGSIDDAHAAALMLQAYLDGHATS